ncbi:MAG: hypothetical protein QOF89_3200 [Acidobacteriota bacterium]|nr:hypothetical protein [Acidobacteriota bacterium]
MRKRLMMLATMLVLVLGASRGTYAQSGTGNGTAGSGDTATTYSNDNGDRGHNWGWLGLIGLAGLAGLRRRETSSDVRTTAAPVR